MVPVPPAPAHALQEFQPLFESRLLTVVCPEERIAAETTKQNAAIDFLIM
jgi:hypothetical protein